MVAEQVGQLVGLVGRRAEQLRPGIADDPQLVPEVLGAFAPLVDVLGGGLRRAPPHRPPPVAGSCCDSPGSTSSQESSAATSRGSLAARLDRLARRVDLSARSPRGGGRRARPARVSSAPLPALRGLGREVVAEALAQRRQRLQLDLGVAAAGEQAAGVAVAAVFGLEELLAELVADQAQQPPAASSGLCGRRGSRCELVLLGPGEPLQRLLGPAQGDPAHALAGLSFFFRR